MSNNSSESGIKKWVVIGSIVGIIAVIFAGISTFHLFGSDTQQPIVIVKVNNTGQSDSITGVTTDENKDKTTVNLSTSSSFVDNFFTDTSLNTLLWANSSPIIQNWWAVDRTLSPSSTNINFVPIGIQLSGARNLFDVNGIQSISSFSPPFTLTAQVQNIQGPEYFLALSDGNRVSHHGFALTGFSNNDCSFGYADMKTSQNAIHTSSNSGWCTFTITVDQGGVGILSFGDKTLPIFIDAGPFYLILGERVTQQSESDPNNNHPVTWRYVQLSPQLK